MDIDFAKKKTESFETVLYSMLFTGVEISVQTHFNQLCWSITQANDMCKRIQAGTCVVHYKSIQTTFYFKLYNCAFFLGFIKIFILFIQSSSFFSFSKIKSE